MMSQKSLVILSLWIVATCIAFAVDRPVAEWVQARGWNRKPFGLNNMHWMIEAMKAPGEFVTAIIAALLLLVFYRRRPPVVVNRWLAAGFVVGAGALTGLSSFPKWIVGRRRPVAGIEPANFDWFAGGIPGLLGAEKNLSFPSGHAALAFATASALALLLPRWKWLFYAAAAVTAVERFAENAHYVSDTVVGAAMGCLATYAIMQGFVWVCLKRAWSCRWPMPDRRLRARAAPAEPAMSDA